VSPAARQASSVARLLSVLVALAAGTVVVLDGIRQALNPDGAFNPAYIVWGVIAAVITFIALAALRWAWRSFD
jgi:hypothetical protein